MSEPEQNSSGEEVSKAQEQGVPEESASNDTTSKPGTYCDHCDEHVIGQDKMGDVTKMLIVLLTSGLGAIYLAFRAPSYQCPQCGQSLSSPDYNDSPTPLNKPELEGTSDHTSDSGSKYDLDLAPDESRRKTIDAYVGEMMGTGDDKQINGKLHVTDRRLIFHGSRTLSFSERHEQIPLDQIRSVSIEKGAIQATLHVNDMKFTAQNKSDMDMFRTHLRKARRQSSSSSSGNDARADEGSSNELDPLDQLEKLNDLKNKGAISDEEFEQKKSKLLDEV